MSEPKKIWGREPVAFVTAVQALLTLAVVFGLDLTEEQIAAILTATGVVLGLIARSKVTPVVDGAP